MSAEIHRLSRTAANAPKCATPHPIRTSIARHFGAVGLAACSLAALADQLAIPLPPQYSEPVCQSLVLDAGRMIAWARWEQRIPLEKVRSDPFQREAPEWVMRLVGGWITDAYEWKATDDQIYQWAAELGSTKYLPTAGQLTVHETIAIWLRRIARQCTGSSA